MRGFLALVFHNKYSGYTQENTGHGLRKQPVPGSKHIELMIRPIEWFRKGQDASDCATGAGDRINTPSRNDSGLGFGSVPDDQKGKRGYCNTPLNSQNGVTARFDYLNATGKVENLGELLELLQPGDQVWAIKDYPKRQGCHLYSHRASLPCGASVWFARSDDGFDCWLDMSGSYWAEQCMWTAWERLAALVNRLGFSVTRIDIAADDYGRVVTPGVVADLVRRGKRDPSQRHHHGFREFEYMESSSKKGIGETAYLGKRGGRKLLRCYDAQMVHDIQAIRWELQLREFKANYVATEFVRRFDEGKYRDKDNVRDNERWTKDMVEHLLNIVFSSVDFRIPRGKEKNVERLERVSWWGELCRSITERVRVPLPKRTQSLKKSMDWLYRSVAPSLAVWCASLGPDRFYNDFLQAIVSDGRRRLNDVQWSLIRSTKLGYCDELLKTVG